MPSSNFRRGCLCLLHINALRRGINTSLLPLAIDKIVEQFVSQSRKKASLNDKKKTRATSPMR